MIFRRNNKGNGPVIVNEGRSLDGIDVLGFFTAEHGVGEAARVLTSTLQAAGVSVSTIDYTDTQSRREHLFHCDNVSRNKVLMMAVISASTKLACDVSNQLARKNSFW